MALQYVIREHTGYDRSGKDEYREVMIPDGKWLVFAASFYYEDIEYEDVDRPEEFPGYHSSEDSSFTVVGSEPRERYRLSLSSDRRNFVGGYHRSRGTSFYLVGDEPLGVILEKKVDGERVGGFWFSCARQVHKGELGRRPVIKRPQFARPTYEIPLDQNSHLTGKPIRVRDRRRGKVGWARLTEVARLAGLSSEELVRRYFDFTDAELPRLQVLLAADRNKIHCQQVHHGAWQKFGLADLPALFDRDPETIWIRQGFALTVLYLQYLGYVPTPALQTA